jgi:hypothetical protein
MTRWTQTGHSAVGRAIVRRGCPQSVGALMLEVIVRVRTMLGKRRDIRWQILIRHLAGNCYGFLTVFIALIWE